MKKKEQTPQFYADTTDFLLDWTLKGVNGILYLAIMQYNLNNRASNEILATSMKSEKGNLISHRTLFGMGILHRKPTTSICKN